MSNASKAVVKALNLEVVNKHDAELGQIAKRVKSYAAHVKSGAAQMFYCAMRAGQQIARAKELLPHGDLKPWIEKSFPDVSYHTANRWVKFSETIQPKLIEELETAGRKSSTVQLLEAPKSKLKKVDEDVILAAIKKVMDSQGMMEFVRANGIVRDKEKQKHTPGKVTPEDKLAAEVAHEEAVFRQAMDAMLTVLEGQIHLKVPTALRDEGIQMGVRWNNELRELQKSKGGKTKTLTP